MDQVLRRRCREASSSVSELLDWETRYSAVKKEWLAMKWAIDSLSYYLLGCHFFLETDHRALQWRNQMDSNIRLTGWYLSLQPYDQTVQYQSGTANLVADNLSRVNDN